MVNQDVKCPQCGKLIPFDDWADIYDTSADTLSGVYVEKAVYHCDACDYDFTADVVYSLKYVQIVQE